MHKKDGFIATSLIYSFFLVFVAVIMALLNNYISNKTILNRFNEEIIKKIDEPPCQVFIYSKNTLSSSTSGITSGTLTNLVKNSSFNDGLNNWEKVGTINANATINSIAIESANANSYLKQDNISLTANHNYYISIRYFQPNNSANLEVGFNSILTTKQSSLKNATENDWDKMSTIYQATTTSSNTFQIGKSTTNYTDFALFKDILVIDLPQSFKPFKKSWLDNTIPWFDGSIYYILKTDIAYNDEFKITLNNYSIIDVNQIECFNAYGKISAGAIQNGSNVDITIPQVMGDVRCQVK